MMTGRVSEGERRMKKNVIRVEVRFGVFVGGWRRDVDCTRGGVLEEVSYNAGGMDGFLSVWWRGADYGFCGGRCDRCR